MSRRARWWWLLTPLLLVGGCFAWLSNYGVDVAVANVGAVPLTDVRVRVTGNEYELGTLLPGTRRKVRVEAKGDSRVELDWKTPRSAGPRCGRGLLLRRRALDRHGAS